MKAVKCKDFSVSLWSMCLFNANSVRMKVHLWVSVGGGGAWCWLSLFLPPLLGHSRVGATPPQRHERTSRWSEPQTGWDFMWGKRWKPEPGLDRVLLFVVAAAAEPWKPPPFTNYSLYQPIPGTDPILNKKNCWIHMFIFPTVICCIYL